MHWACFYGAADVVKTLAYDANADVEAADDNDVVAADVALDRGHHDCVWLLQVRTLVVWIMISRRSLILLADVAKPGLILHRATINSHMWSDMRDLCMQPEQYLLAKWRVLFDASFALAARTALGNSTSKLLESAPLCLRDRVRLTEFQSVLVYGKPVVEYTRML